MNREWEEKMQSLKSQMEMLAKQMEELEGQKQEDQAEEALRNRIFALQELSRDPYYDQYLGELLRDMEDKKKSLEWIAREIDRTYLLYQARMKGESQNVHRLPEEQRQNPTGERKETPAARLEFTIGAGVLSVIGTLFILISFITLGLHYFEGFFQGIFLYVMAAAVILLSELLLQRKVPRFARGITGLGIAGLYASTIMNYLHLKVISGISAVMISLVIALLSLFLGRKKDSASIRLISFLGCYLCFLPSAVMFETSLDFFAATIILFLVNGIGIFFPNQKNQNLLHRLHMGMNTICTVLFVILIASRDIEPLYFIFYIMLNIILLNVVYRGQEKGMADTLFFCGELGILGFLILFLLHGEAGRAALGDFYAGENRYHRLITLIFTLSIGVFFYLFGKEKKEKIIQYHYAALLSLWILTLLGTPMESIISVLVLFVFTKLFCNQKEYEIGNSIITVFAFMIGLSLAGKWQTWLLFGAFLLSIFFVRRWHLFYQCLISLFLISFLGLRMEFDLFVPLSAALLFALFPLFHHLHRRKGAEEEPENTMKMIGSVINLCGLALLSWLSVFAESFLSGSLTMVIGAAYLILYLSPKYYLNLKRKYLVLAGYLTAMAFFIPVGNSVYVSIFLMVIAIGCVAAGFRMQDKVQRLCGLVLALFVCIKLVIYDFREAESLQKTILFLVVGSIVLAISLIYMQLEKKHHEKQA